MYAVTITSILVKSDGWQVLFTLGTPLLVSLILQEKRVVRISLVMLAGAIVICLLASIFTDHANGLADYMAQSIMVVPALGLLFGLPIAAFNRLDSRKQARKVETIQEAKPS